MNLPPKEYNYVQRAHTLNDLSVLSKVIVLGNVQSKLEWKHTKCLNKTRKY